MPSGILVIGIGSIFGTRPAGAFLVTAPDLGAGLPFELVEEDEGI